MVWCCVSIRPSTVRLSIRLLACKRNGSISFELAVQMYLGVPSVNLWFVQNYLIIYVHSDLISNFIGIQSVIFMLEPSNFSRFENLSCSAFFTIFYNMAVFYESFKDSLTNFNRDFVSM